MLFRYWTEGLIFIAAFLVIMAVPCFGAAWMGTKLINDLGNRPSKSASIQMAMIWKLIGLMIVSFTLLVVFFHIFSD